MMKFFKMRFVYKLAAGILSILLFLGSFWNYSAFLGPGISSAAALTAAGMVTATDIVTSPILSATAAATKVKNYVVALNWSYMYVNNLAFTISSSNVSIKLTGYKIGADVDPSYCSFNDTFETSRNLSFQYTSDETCDDYYASPVLYCYFNNASYSTSIIKNSLSVRFDGGTEEDGSVINYNAFEVLKACLGDVDENGTIDNTDATRVLQIATNSLPSNVTITSAGRLAADVNGDGEINAADALQIQKYVKSTILTFSSPSNAILNLPTSEVNGITDGETYLIGNFSTGQHVAPLNSTTTSPCRLRYYNSATARTEFKVSYSGNGLYTLTNANTKNWLRMNTEYEPTFDSANTLASSMFWYIIPMGNGCYSLVNYAATDRVLTSEGYVKNRNYSPCSAQRLINGSEWFFHTYTPVKINYYYDYGYAVRDSNPAANLRARQLEIANILNNVYGMAVSTTAPVQFKSYGDFCYSSVSAINSSNIDKTCSGSNAFCNAYSGATVTGTTSHTLHHKNGRANLQYLYQMKQNKSNPKDIQILTTGYKSCGKDNETGLHSNDTCAGLAVSAYRVGVIFNSNVNNDYYNQSTALHEISHNLVRLEENDNQSITDTDHGQCVMSYDRDVDELLDNWRARQYEKLYCDRCKNEIVRYLYQFEE